MSTTEPAGGITAGGSNAGTGVLADLLDRAREVLDANWIGASTLPSASLYPHQWSWDSAFIAIGRSWYDQDRAQQELGSLFRAQWANGMVPHLVFNPSVPEGGVLPGAGLLAVVDTVAERATRCRDIRDYPAGHPCSRGAGDAPPRAGRRRVDRLPALVLSAARRPASLPDGPPPAGRDAARGHGPSLGVGTRQLAGLGPGSRRSWSSHPVACRPTPGATWRTEIRRTARPTRPTTGSSTSPRPTGRRVPTTTPASPRLLRTGSPVRCSTGSWSGRSVRSRRSRRSSGRTRRPIADQREIHDGSSPSCGTRRPSA